MSLHPVDRRRPAVFFTWKRFGIYVYIHYIRICVSRSVSIHRSFRHACTSIYRHIGAPNDEFSPDSGCVSLRSFLCPSYKKLRFQSFFLFYYYYLLFFLTIDLLFFLTIEFSSLKLWNEINMREEASREQLWRNE